MSLPYKVTDENGNGATFTWTEGGNVSVSTWTADNKRNGPVVHISREDWHELIAILPWAQRIDVAPSR